MGWYYYVVSVNVRYTAIVMNILQAQMMKKEIISYYIKKAYKYATIVLFLRLQHNIEISIRTLKRRL